MIFTVPGNPVAQGRPRFRRFGKFVSTYDPKKSVDFKSKIAAFAVQSGVKMIEGPASLEIRVFVRRPKRLMSRKFDEGVIRCVKKPDADNFSKAAMDALTGIAWRDDAQVCLLVVGKWYHEKGGSARMEIEVGPISGGEYD